MRTHELRMCLFGRTIRDHIKDQHIKYNMFHGFMFDWHMKSCVESFICTIIIFVTNKFKNYLPLYTDFNLSLSDPTLYLELSRRPIFESPRLLYITLSGHPSIEMRYNACSTSDSLGEHLLNPALHVFLLDALCLFRIALSTSLDPRRRNIRSHRIRLSSFLS